MLTRLPLLPLLVALLAGCQSMPGPPLKTVPYVDLERFMGPWYVIAHIPSWPERNAYNAVESYALAPDGTIETTFTFREGGFEGEEERMQPRGYVMDRQSNAVWGMQFIWPIKAEYLITYLDEDYSLTIVSRNKRDYVWLMARTPSIPDAVYEEMVDIIAGQGYDISELRRVPQRWP